MEADPLTRVSGAPNSNPNGRRCATRSYPCKGRIRRHPPRHRPFSHKNPDISVGWSTSSLPAPDPDGGIGLRMRFAIASAPNAPPEKRGRNRRFCSSLPNSMIGLAVGLFVLKMMPVATQAAEMIRTISK